MHVIQNAQMSVKIYVSTSQAQEIQTLCPLYYIIIIYIPGGPKKRPEFRMALCNRVSEMNQPKSLYVMSKYGGVLGENS